MIFLLFLLLFIIGAPIYSLIAGMTLTSYSEAEIPLVVIILEFFNMSNIPMLLALPLFTLTGYLLAKSEAPKRLIYFSSTFFKLIPNNLIFLSLFLAIFFGAITGSSGITIIAFGSLLYSLLNDRFSDNYLYGFITTSGG
ncbi:MAG: TRAP transporter large permease subunit, partial [Proteobacteria bacterium]|nr:TRAP transporter large permease subunit [Pseudomonadota bacterium]